MSTNEYIASFPQSADAMFALLIDAEKHNRILPFCKSVAVLDRRTAADGRTVVEMRHVMAFQRMGIEAELRSTLTHRSADRTLDMVSHIGEGTGGLVAAGRVVPRGTGSKFRLLLDISTMPLRYRLLIIDPILRRAHVKLIEKMTRRAAEVAPIGPA